MKTELSNELDDHLNKLARAFRNEAVSLAGHHGEDAAMRGYSFSLCMSAFAGSLCAAAMTLLEISELLHPGEMNIDAMKKDLADGLKEIDYLPIARELLGRGMANWEKEKGMKTWPTKQ